MKLFSELKRRNVHRMAVLYAVTSWLIMQAAEVVMTLAALPEWTGQLTLILLALGFPIALIFSWFYELTPEGISLEKDIKAGESITHVTGRRLDFIVIAMLCAAVIMFAYDKWWISGSPVTSIAVLPLDDFSADAEQQYLADSMTEVLTAELGQIESLQVTSRTSAMQYKDTNKLLPQIADELRVDAIVEGSIQPAGDKVRFTLQLIDGRTDRHLWARSYHRDLRDILTLQGEIARAIAGEIQVTLTPQTEARLARDRTVDSEALRLWAVGNHHLMGLNDDSFSKALQAFIEASNRDPEFAPAYAGIARAYYFLGSWFGSHKLKSILPLARMAAEKAVRLDPDLAEARFALAVIYQYEWQWDAADQEFLNGAALNASDAIGLMEYANFLTAMGRADEAIEIARRAVQLDPVLPSAYNELGWALSASGPNANALEQYQKALQLDSDYFQTHWALTYHHINAGEFDEALPHLQKLGENLELTVPTQVGYVGRFYARIGRHGDARDILELLRKRMETEYVPAMALALVHLGLEDYEEAIPLLEAAYEERDPSLIWLRYIYALPDTFRNDPRFQGIMNRMNFPET